MANYFFTTVYGNVGKGSPHANYILAEGKYKGKENEIAYSTSHLPSWAETSSDFWKEADLRERANARVYREFRFSLPNELTLEENKKIVDTFIQNTLSDKHYYTAVIHDKEAAFDNSKQNVHCHIMFSERTNDGIERDSETYFKRYNGKNPQLGGAKKTTDFNSKDKLIELRKELEVLINTSYLENNLDIKVSCESLITQKKNAELEGDFLKAEMLDRNPIYINSYTLRKPIETLSLNEKEQLTYYHLCKEIRDMKTELYMLQLEEKENALLNNSITSIETTKAHLDTNNIEQYINNEKELDFISNKLLDLNNISQDDLELKALCILNKEFNNINRNYEVLENELSLLSTQDINNPSIIKEISIVENKLFNLSEAIRIEIENMKENSKDFISTVDLLKNNLSDEKASLNINYMNLLKENNELKETIAFNDKSTAFFEKSFDYNLSSYLDINKHFNNIKFEIAKFERSIEEPKLTETALNINSKGEYKKLKDLEQSYKDRLEIIEIKSIKMTGKELEQLSIEKELTVKNLKDIQDQFSKLKNSFNPNNILDIKNAIKLKAESKLNTLREQQSLTTVSLHKAKSLLIDSDSNRSTLNKLVSEKQSHLINLQKEQSIIKLKREQLDNTFTFDNAIKAAKNRLTDNKYSETLTKYKSISEKLVAIEKDITNTSFININTKNSLYNEKNNLLREQKQLKEDYSNFNTYFINNKSLLLTELDKIVSEKEVQLNIYSKQEKNISNEIFSLESDIKSLSIIEKEMKFTEPNNLFKLNNYQIDSNNAGGGSTQNIEDFLDNKKKKKRDFER